MWSSKLLIYVPRCISLNFGRALIYLRENIFGIYGFNIFGEPQLTTFVESCMLFENTLLIVKQLNRRVLITFEYFMENFRLNCRPNCYFAQCEQMKRSIPKVI